MSSVAAPASPAPRRRSLALPQTLTGASALGLGVGVALGALAFAARAGLGATRTGWVAIAVLLVAGALGVVSVLLAPPWRRLWGGATLAIFAALAALTAASTSWSVQPADSWLEAGRTAAYLAAFATGVALVRLAPRRWPALLGGVLVAGVGVSLYGLAAKVAPEALGEDELYMRVRQPFQYWNASGLLAALAVAPALWLGARRSGHGALNALAVPALGLLLVTLLLSFSRGSLVAAGAAAVVWFALVPLRLRGLAVLGPAALGGGAVVAWTLAQDSLTTDQIPLGLRQEAGHELGVALAAMVLGLLVAGLALEFALARGRRAPRTRRRAGYGAAIALVLLPAVALGGLAAGGVDLRDRLDRGIEQFTDPDAPVGGANVPGRLADLSSGRATYYRDAAKIWRDHELLGAGAGGFATARPRHRTDDRDVRHAHSFVAQTLADLGLVGLGIGALGILAWLVAAARTLRLGRPAARPRVGAEAVGLATLTAVVVTFAVHGLLDWTWFVPGTTLLALVCAGWVAGRGPVDEHPAGPRPGRRPGRARALGAAAVALVALGSAWAVWQPLRSTAATDSALAAVDAGRLGAAARSAADARARNPLAIEPLFAQARVQDAANDTTAALATLRRAARLQPANPRTWRRLSEYALGAFGASPEALRAAARALYLDPRDPRLSTTYLIIRRELAQRPARRG